MTANAIANLLGKKLWLEPAGQIMGVSNASRTSEAKGVRVD